MSKPLKIIGTIAGVVALVVPGLQALGVATILGMSAGAIAGVAGLVSGVAMLASRQLAKPPPVRGSVSQLIVDPNAPQPYVMGEGYFAGVLRHREAYGGTVDGVPNPYMLDVVVYGGGGPYQSITPQIEFAAVPAWYSGYLASDTQLGACPEASALTASYGTPSGWGSSHKLSGQAAIAWNYKFDKTGKKFASGLPQTGALIEGAKVYDPRLDSSFPGGSGSCTLGDETTYVYSENPALHAGTYAYGRYQNGKRVLGIGLPADGIDWETLAAWANVCDTNGWTLFGVAFEPGDKGQNLIDICAAGGGEPVPGGTLSFRYHAPVVALDTITVADIADEDMRVVAMQSFRDRVNVVLPKYRSPTHNWEMVQAEAVSDPDFVTEDGEERPIEWPFNFVKDVDQAAQLAAYKLFESRELHPIELVCMPRLRAYRVGDCLHLDLPPLGLDTDAIILHREIDPRTMKVRLTLIGETAAKHAWALGLTGDAPPTPAIGQTAEERDETAAGAADRQVVVEVVGVKAFAADHTGVISAGLPAYIVPKVTMGGADIRLEDSVSYSITPSGVAASVENTNGDPDKGTIEITDVTALNGQIDLVVTVAGVAQPAKSIVVQKSTGLPPGLGGAGSKIASDSSFPTLSGTGYVDLTDVMTLTVATGESLYGSAPLDYWIGSTSAVSRTATARWRYSPAGAGTWSSFDTGDIAGTAALGGYAAEAGHGDFNDVATGLAAGDYDVKLEGKLNSAGVNVAFVGTATIEAKD